MSRFMVLPITCFVCAPHPEFQKLSIWPKHPDAFSRAGPLKKQIFRRERSVQNRVEAVRLKNLNSFCQACFFRINGQDAYQLVEAFPGYFSVLRF